MCRVESWFALDSLGVSRVVLEDGIFIGRFAF
jgi:hypothetical protein